MTCLRCRCLNRYEPAPRSNTRSHTHSNTVPCQAPPQTPRNVRSTVMDKLTAPRDEDGAWRAISFDSGQPEKKFDLRLDSYSGQTLFYGLGSTNRICQSDCHRHPVSSRRVRLVKPGALAGVRRRRVVLAGLRLGDVLQAPPTRFARPATAFAGCVEVRSCPCVDNSGSIVRGHAAIGVVHCGAGSGRDRAPSALT
jgi:hypothetical protein